MYQPFSLYSIKCVFVDFCSRRQQGIGLVMELGARIRPILRVRLKEGMNLLENNNNKIKRFVFFT